MGLETSIEWCDATWNPWRGCRHVSAGGDHCYMYTAQRRYGLDPTQVQRSRTTFHDPLKWHEPRRIFTCSWSDFFISDADPWRAEAWDIIRQTPQHTYQILTKRPRRIRRCLPPDWGDGWPHVWLGVSVEHTEAAVRRLPVLRQVPAAVRFLSIEPLLAPIDPAVLDLTGIAWVIVGGESGRDYRPMPHEWVWPIRDACLAQGVAFFFKQSAAPRNEQGTALRHEDGTYWCWQQWPDDRRPSVRSAPHCWSGEDMAYPPRQAS